MDKIEITATQINYYFVCERKLWYFSHQLNLESTSELVEIGKIIHETSYEREKKEIEIGPIKIDFIGSDGVVREIKKSSKMESAHIWQLKYYLYYLNNLGVPNLKGEIVYPKQKQKTKVVLTEKDKKDIEEILESIEMIVSNTEVPPVINKVRCKKCSYYELCYI
jgi:CRISPR-associated exonuclease Cas4